MPTSACRPAVFLSRSARESLAAPAYRARPNRLAFARLEPTTGLSHPLYWGQRRLPMQCLLEMLKRKAARRSKLIPAAKTVLNASVEHSRRAPGPRPSSGNCSLVKRLAPVAHRYRLGPISAPQCEAEDWFASVSIK